ncbi:hypothetical protein [Fusibacter ferrireducens]|uniref:SipL SPOCS domain-containing protein n=1 Tax=Fusibacter ferrireducens TaxID=2785058 RepID=A0ABR9ZS61_9FIRM|nr:hypothetical protein [Fusibacter ferrireducens]MBF4693275.1 hypothetical protein [Fusibacter ferrireducens]
MLRDQNVLPQEIQGQLPDKLSKVFYLEASEVIELEMPLVVDVTKLLVGKIIVTTRSIYPVNKFVNLDLVITDLKYSLIGRIKSFRAIEGRLYEITIFLEDFPESLVMEIESYYVER